MTKLIDIPNQEALILITEMIKEGLDGSIKFLEKEAVKLEGIKKELSKLK